MSRISLKLHARPFFNERGDEYRHCHLSLYTFRSHCASNIHILHYFLSSTHVNVYEKIHRHDLCSQLHRVCALLYFVFWCVCVSVLAGCVYCSPQTQPTLKEYLSLSASSAGGI
jgi:hypothetical protein